MAFILKTDLYKAIKAEELAQITRGDDTIVNYGIDSAISEMKGYLAASFDIDSIFNQTGTSRHALLLNFGIDISIFVIVSQALPGQDLEDRKARYKRAVDWLKQVRSNEIKSDLPVLPDTSETEKTRGAIGEHTKRTNYY